MPPTPGESAVAGNARHGRGVFRSRDGGGQTTVKRPRRALGSAVAHAPQVLRALVRADEVWLLVVAAGIGVAAGISVWLINGAAQLFHENLFGIGPHERLSAMAHLSPIATVAVPCLGGLALGLITLGIGRIYTRRSVDPIEANALFGGRMSLTGSLVVVLQTIISNGVGASIGLEAAYTQIGSALASKFGHAFRVRRNDMRLLVGCGAAAAIAGAFNAPLTGSFYAFELVIGTYSIGTFGPVAVAALVSMAVVHALGGQLFELSLLPAEIDPLDYIPILALGMLCALLGIAIMRGVTLTEFVFRRLGLSGLVATGDRWPRGRDPGAVHAGGAVVRPWRDRRGGRRRIPADPSAVAGRIEGDGVGDLDRLGVPRRTVLRVAVSRRRTGQGVRRDRRRRQPGTHDLTDHMRPGRHERTGGGDHRRPADHGIPGAGSRPAACRWRSPCWRPASSPP